MKKGCGVLSKTKTQTQTLFRLIALTEMLMIELLTDQIEAP
jgi:hypothetical protein